MPSLAAVAVNVIGPPHTLVLLAVIATLGVTDWLTDSVTVLDVILAGVAHAALEVNTTLTTSLLTGAAKL